MKYATRAAVTAEAATEAAFRITFVCSFFADPPVFCDPPAVFVSARTVFPPAVTYTTVFSGVVTAA